MSYQLSLIEQDLTSAELDQLELLALAADEQRRTGGIEWPGKPSRQRLELFLACGPLMVLRLVRLGRRALERP